MLIMSASVASTITALVAIAGVIVSLVGLVFNVRYLLRRRGKRQYRAIKMFNSLAAVAVAVMYVLYRLGITPMPEGGYLLSFGLLALLVCITAGALANDS